MIRKEIGNLIGKDVMRESLARVKDLERRIELLEEKLDILSEVVGSKEQRDKDREVLENTQERIREVQDFLHGEFLSNEYLSNEYLSLYKYTDNKKPKVLICGFYGAKNVGDELMLEALLKILPVTSLDITILLSNNGELDASEYAPYKILHYPRYSSDIVAIAEAFDVVVWGGGAMLDDVEYKFRGRYSTMTYILMAITKAVLKRGGQAFVYGVSSNKKISDVAFINDLSFIINRSDFFSLRDNDSLTTLEEAGITTSKVRIIDDLGIYNLKNFVDKPRKSKSETQVIGINLIMFEDKLIDYRKILANIVDCFDKPIKLIFIPFYSYHNYDNVLLMQLIDEIKDNSIKTEIVKQPNNTAELLDIYSKCDYVFAMRYHGVLIAALTHKHVIMIDFKKHHRHYANKNKQIKTKYAPNLSVIDYDEILNGKINKKLLLQANKIDVKAVNKIATNIEKIIKDSIKSIRGLR